MLTLRTIKAAMAALVVSVPIGALVLAATSGEAQAQSSVPPVPIFCSDNNPITLIKVGDEWRGVGRGQFDSVGPRRVKHFLHCLDLGQVFTEADAATTPLNVRVLVHLEEESTSWGSFGIWASSADLQPGRDIRSSDVKSSSLANAYDVRPGQMTAMEITLRSGGQYFFSGGNAWPSKRGQKGYYRIEVEVYDPNTRWGKFYEARGD